MTPSVRLAHLLQQTGSFIMKHFIVLLAATGLPLLISYGVVWLTIGATFSRIQTTGSYEELITLFSPSSTLSYTLVLVGLVVFAINLIGWIAGPLVTIEQDRITLRTLFPRALKYFGPYFALALIVLLAAIVLQLFIFLIITIIITMVGFVDQNAIITVENYLIISLPDIGLFLLVLSVMFAPYFLIEQNLTAWQAILKSMGLVKRHFITTLVRFLLIAVLILLISFILGFIPIVGGALAYLIGGMTLTVYNYHLYKGLTTAEQSI